jgi:hypothetical protein
LVHDDGYFDERVAAGYDEDAAERFAPALLDPNVDFLAGLAGSGTALELGIGTGRVALRSRHEACPYTGSTFPKRWWAGSAPSPAATRSR